MRLTTITPTRSGVDIIQNYDVWVHAAASDKKSSADTAPAVTCLIDATSSQEGIVSPLRTRLMVVRSTPALEAMRSSVSPSAHIHSLSFMPRISALDARACQAPVALDAVDSEPRSAQHARMPKTSKRRPTKPNFIAAWREHFGNSLASGVCSQEEVAERTGYHRTTITRIENGKGSIQLGLLEQLAELFGCSQGDLLERHPTWPKPVDISRLKEADQKLVQRTAEALEMKTAG